LARFVIPAVAILFAGALLLAFPAGAEEHEENFSPELSLHFNMKEDDSLSPQYKLPDEAEGRKTVQADVDYDIGGILIGRNPVPVGEWIAGEVAYAQFITVSTANIWYEEEDGSGNNCEWTFDIKVNDQSVSEQARDCQEDHPTVGEETYNLNVELELVAGDVFSVELTYEGWEDITIYYDNVTYDTGYSATSTPLSFFDTRLSSGSLAIEFTEAWPVDWTTNLKGGYVMVMGPDAWMADNNRASVSQGSEHAMSNGTMATGTVLTWEGVTVSELTVMFHYTQFDHMASNNTNGTSNPPMITLDISAAATIGGDGGGLLGLPGFPLLLAATALAWVSRRR
jgi:hypothetical protein